MRCAFLTTDDLSGYVADDDLAIPPLRERGIDVVGVPWRAEVDWRAFHLVVVRTTWDYHRHPRDFLAALERIEVAGTPLQNPLPLIRWNLRKTYLRELETKGVAVVPTVWLDRLDAAALEAAADRLRAGRLVVKPVVGASAEDTFRVRVDGPSTAAVAGAADPSPDRSPDDPTILARFRSRPVMVQPYLPSVTGDGEWAAMSFDGSLSHVVRKRPRPGDFRVQEEHGGSVERVEPDAALLAAVRQATDWIMPTPLYARVDFLRDDGGRFLLSELELIEPALYLRADPAAPDRLARAIALRIDQHRHG